jgi:wyosine [tRNA(Phe)-imidazoG37] synthetase (radical SAM superfamily)
LKELNLAFGPVPSRRLGRSLGINNIPAKTCTFSCIYCQVGRTLTKTITRRTFYTSKTIFDQVRRKVNRTLSGNERIDYLTFVPDGEPTLDINLRTETSLLRQFGTPIAVITNSSLIDRDDVRYDLSQADLVSLKIDSVNESTWKRVNRPHRELRLHRILDGVSDFVVDYKGTVISETMLVDGFDYTDEGEQLANFLKNLKNLEKAYIAIPTRPPTEKWVRPVDEKTLNSVFQVFSSKLGEDKVEYLIGYEGNAFSFTGEVCEDLLSITAVHPMRKDAVEKLLNKSGSDWAVVEKLLHEQKLVEQIYEGDTFYLRRPLDRI